MRPQLPNNGSIITKYRVTAVTLFACLLAVIFLFVRFDHPGVGAQTAAIRRYKPELVVQTGHAMPVSFLKFSPNGRYVLSGDGQTTKLWDAASGRELRTLGELHSDYTLDYRRISFSLDSRYIVDGVTVIDVMTGGEVKTFKPVLPVSSRSLLSPDNSRFVSVGGEYVQIWSVTTGETIGLLHAPIAALNPKRMLLVAYGDVTGLTIQSVPKNANSNANSSVRPSAPVYPNDGRIHIVSLVEGKEVRAISGLSGKPKDLAFSDDGRRLISIEAKGMRAWDVDTGAEVGSVTADLSHFGSINISPRGDSAVYSYRKEFGPPPKYYLWQVDGRRNIPLDLEVDRDEGGGVLPEIAYFSDGSKIAISEFTGRTDLNEGDSRLRLLDSTSGRVLESLDIGRAFRSYSGIPIDIGPGDSTFAIGRGVGSALWDISRRGPLRSFDGNANDPRLVSLARNGHTIAVGSVKRAWIDVKARDQGAFIEPSVQIWDLTTASSPKEVRGSMDYSGPFAGNGYMMMSAGGQFFNYHDQYLTTRVNRHTDDELDLTADEIADGGEFWFWDVSTGASRDDLRNFVASRKTGKNEHIYDAEASPDGTAVGLIVVKRGVPGLTSKDRTSFELWNIGGQSLRWEAEVPDLDKGIHFDADGKMVTAGGIRFYADSGLPDLDQTETSNDRSIFEHIGEFTVNGHSYTARIGTGRIGLFDTATHEPIAELYWLNKDDWAVITPTGSFDASDGAQAAMHFIVADPDLGYETISLDQLKSRYQVPGLLQKLFNGGDLPKVGEFSITLPPAIALSQPKAGESKIDIALNDRGGGIGRIEVRINGNELTNDARTTDAAGKALSDLTADIPLERLRQGMNKVEVIAWNLEGDVRGRPAEIVLERADTGVTARSDRVYIPEPDKKPSEVNFYAVVSGISDYAGSGLQLRYAAKDAEDISKALMLAARKYFCSNEMLAKRPCERVHLRLLSTEKRAGSQFTGLDDVPDEKRLDPSKQGFRDVFSEIAAKAKPEDVVVVYMAGHGTAITSDQAVVESAFPDMYLYPTREATTLDRSAMVNRTEREGTTVSSLELARWVADITADKKVMILDTCSAGAVQKDLVAQARSDDALQMRSLDRLRERTGLYILMGSAANAVSYEANEFRQGLLTYSLIEAMTTDKGLREGKFLDVENWFNYCEDKVEELARGIGGIQRPSYFKSNFAKTFDIGRIERDEQLLIPLAHAVPLILRPELREKEKFTDRERLTEKLEASLFEMSLSSVRGGADAVNYVNATNAANGLSPRGYYVVDGDQVTVELSLVRDEEEIAKIKLSAPKGQIVEKLLREMIRAAQGNK